MEAELGFFMKCRFPIRRICEQAETGPEVLSESRGMIRTVFQMQGRYICVADLSD